MYKLLLEVVFVCTQLRDNCSLFRGTNVISFTCKKKPTTLNGNHMTIRACVMLNAWHIVVRV